jgi:hypothetical protein
MGHRDVQAVSDSGQSPSYGRSPRANPSGDRLQQVLFVVGAILFLGAVVAMTGIPGTPLGGPGTDDGGIPLPTPEPTGNPTPGSPGSTATPSSDGPASPTAEKTASPAAKQVGTPVYRVNVGGFQIVSSAGPDWSGDTANNPSQYLNVKRSETVATDTPDGIRVVKKVPSTAPKGMFKSYRISKGGDDPGHAEMVWRFPVKSNRTYQVRIYVVEAFFTDGEGDREYEQPYQESGPRTFGIAINGDVVLENYEPFVEYGHDVGGMKSFKATADDGVITVRFVREVENPTVSGIEIVETGSLDGKDG